MADASPLNLLRAEKKAATADLAVVANTKEDAIVRTLVAQAEAVVHLMAQADAKKAETNHGDAALAAMTVIASQARTNTAGNQLVIV